MASISMMSPKRRAIRSSYMGTMNIPESPYGRHTGINPSNYKMRSMIRQNGDQLNMEQRLPAGARRRAYNFRYKF